jgi:hypothetical protein
MIFGLLRKPEYRSFTRQKQAAFTQLLIGDL